MTKDYKKEYKDLYLPKVEPAKEFFVEYHKIGLINILSHVTQGHYEDLKEASKHSKNGSF
jgi:hypothetical protein